MGAFDQAARDATRDDPDAVLLPLLAPTGVALPFQDWFDTRTAPLPLGGDRTVDLVAILDDANRPNEPVHLVIECESRPDAAKVDVTLEEVALMWARRPAVGVRPRPLAALVYLTDRCPTPVIDLTLPGGFGTRHAPLNWNVAEEDATAALDAVVAGTRSWGTLFWVSLMAGAGGDDTVRRWVEVVDQFVTDATRRRRLAFTAMLFADLTLRTLVWERILKEAAMWTESTVANNWIREGLATGRLEKARENVVRILRRKFAGLITDDIVRMVNEQSEPSILDGWFDAAISATSISEFTAALRG